MQARNRQARPPCRQRTLQGSAACEILRVVGGRVNRRERERARVWGGGRSEGENGEGEKEREVVVGVRTTRTVWCWWCGATLCLQRTNNVAKGHRRDERGSKQRDVTRAEVRHCRYHARRPINDGIGGCGGTRLLCLHFLFSSPLLFFLSSEKKVGNGVVSHASFVATCGSDLRVQPFVN